MLTYNYTLMFRLIKYQVWVKNNILKLTFMKFYKILLIYYFTKKILYFEINID